MAWNAHEQRFKCGKSLDVDLEGWT